MTDSPSVAGGTALSALYACGGEATRDELFERMDVKTLQAVSDEMRRLRYQGRVRFTAGGTFKLTE